MRLAPDLAPVASLATQAEARLSGAAIQVLISLDRPMPSISTMGKCTSPPGTSPTSNWMCQAPEDPLTALTGHGAPPNETFTSPASYMDTSRGVVALQPGDTSVGHQPRLRQDPAPNAIPGHEMDMDALQSAPHGRMIRICSEGQGIQA